MTDIFASRREKLRSAMRARGLDAMLISQAANRFYLSGFELHDPQFNESAGRLVIAADDGTTGWATEMPATLTPPPHLGARKRNFYLRRQRGPRAARPAAPLRQPHRP